MTFPLALVARVIAQVGRSFVSRQTGIQPCQRLQVLVDFSLAVSALAVGVYIETCFKNRS